MTLRALVESYLQEEPKFRERTAKDRGIVNLIINKYGLGHLVESRQITKDMLIEIVQAYATMDRAWRKTLQERPELRGADYEEKDELEIQAQAALGYNVRGTDEAAQATLI